MYISPISNFSPSDSLFKIDIIEYKKILLFQKPLNWRTCILLVILSIYIVVYKSDLLPCANLALFEKNTKTLTFSAIKLLIFSSFFHQYLNQGLIFFIFFVLKVSLLLADYDFMSIRNN